MTENPSPRPPAPKSNRLVLWALAVAAGVAVIAKAHEIVVEPEQSAFDYLGALPLEGPAPELELKDREGAPVRLEQFRGRWVFLNFWATWCEACRAEMPSMGRLARRLAGEDFAMVAASVDEGWEPVDAFFGDERPAFAVFHDPEAKTATRFGTTKFPETWLIGPDGRLRARFVGPRDWGDPAFAVYLEGLLGRAPPAGGP